MCYTVDDAHRTADGKGRTIGEKTMTEKPKHTPGPWRMDRFGAILANDANDGAPGTARIVADVRDTVNWGTPKEKAIANGYLIAAAPNLLDFVKSVAVGECYNDPGEYPEPGESGVSPCLRCQAKALVTKAEEGAR